MNETTPEHKSQFASYIYKWQDVLNLHDWRVEAGIKPATGAMADMSVDLSARLAVWRLGKSFGAEPVTDRTLNATACHEMLHVLLADLVAAVENKAAPELVAAAEHRVINTLERLLVPQIATSCKT